MDGVMGAEENGGADRTDPLQRPTTKRPGSTTIYTFWSARPKSRTKGGFLSVLVWSLPLDTMEVVVVSRRSTLFIPVPSIGGDQTVYLNDERRGLHCHNKL